MTPNSDTQMIPVRALNQVTYCPRLYYLEYVDSVMPLNEHVEDGLFQHRRVDDPDLQHHTRKEGDAEEFRAIIADSVVLTLVNNGSLTPKDFLVWRDVCQLTEEGRKRFLQAYEQRKATVVIHPVFGYRMSYGRMIEVQAQMLAAHVRGDIPEYTGFTAR